MMSHMKEAVPFFRCRVAELIFARCAEKGEAEIFSADSSHSDRRFGLM